MYWIIKNTIKVLEILKFLVFYLENIFNSSVQVDNISLIAKDKVITPKMLFFLKNNYEQEERDLVESHLERDDKVLEIGAGIGYLALFCILEKKISDYTLVEANNQLIKVIKKNFLLNNVEIENFTLINKLLDNESNLERVFFITKSFWSSSVYQRNETAQKITVRTININNILGSITYEPNVLIMDIEGGEIEVDFKDFSRFEKIIIEIHPDIIGSDRASNLITGFIENGYKLVDYNNRSFYFNKSTPS